MRVLITGGAGYKGCVLADELIAHGHTVTVLDALRYGEDAAMTLLHRGVRVVRGDVTRPDQVAPLVREHDAVVHLAGYVGYPLCDAEPIMARAVNVDGTGNVVAALAPGQPLVYASTGAVYGRVEDLCTEDTPPSPLSHYGRTKLAGEVLALQVGAVSLRFPTVMGVSPCMRFDLLVNAFVYRAVQIGWMVCYQAHDRRSFVDVADAAAAYRFALEHYDRMSGQVYNVGAESLNLSKKEVLDVVCAHHPMRVIYEDIAQDPDQRNYSVSFVKLAALGFSTRVGLTESVAAIGRAAAISQNHGRWRFQA